jgi:hypothetical protein
VRQHCAQCLSEVLTDGQQAPNGEILCLACYSALWGPRQNGDRLASNGNGRNGNRRNGNGRRGLLKRSRGHKQGSGRAVWLVGPTFETEISGSFFRPGIWRRHEPAA